MRLRAEVLSSGQRRTRAASEHNAAQNSDCSEEASTSAHWRGPQASCRSHQQHAKLRPTTPSLQKLMCSLVAVAGCRERMQAELESADDGRPRQLGTATLAKRGKVSCVHYLAGDLTSLRNIGKWYEIPLFPVSLPLLILYGARGGSAGGAIPVNLHHCGTHIALRPETPRVRARSRRVHIASSLAGL